METKVQCDTHRFEVTSRVSKSSQKNHADMEVGKKQSSRCNTKQSVSKSSKSQKSNGRVGPASKKSNPVQSDAQSDPSSSKNEYTDLYKTPVVEPLPLSRGPISSDFVILKVIGQGAFGKVLQVAHRGSGQVYAMKVYSKKFLADHDQLEYTISEKLIMTRMRHPYVIRLRYAFQTSDKLFLLSDYCAGGELFNILRKQGCFLENQARVYLAQLVLALEYMHAHGVIHRDLKPENILLDACGHINLTDFGLAKDFTVAVNTDQTPKQQHGFLTSNQDYDYITLMREAVARKPAPRGRRGANEPVEYVHPHIPHPEILTKSLVGTDEYLAPEMILCSTWYFNKLKEEREKNEKKRQAAAGGTTPGTGTEASPSPTPAQTNEAGDAPEAKPKQPSGPSGPTGPTGPGYDRSVDLWALGALAFEMLTGDAPFRDKSKMQLYRKILNGRLVYPRHLSRDAISLIKGLLERDPNRRMGYVPGSDAVSVFRGMDQIKQHPFFSTINWDKLMRREVQSPLPVNVTSVTDYSHFDTYFTDMELTLDLEVHKPGKAKAAAEEEAEAGKKKRKKNDAPTPTTASTPTKQANPTALPLSPTLARIATTASTPTPTAASNAPSHPAALPALRIPRVSDTTGSSVVSGTPIQVRSRETVGDTHTEHADPPPRLMSDSPLPVVTPSTHPELYQQLAHQQMGALALETTNDPSNMLGDAGSGYLSGSNASNPALDIAPSPSHQQQQQQQSPPLSLAQARLLPQLQGGALGYGSPLLRPMAPTMGRSHPTSALSRVVTTSETAQDQPTSTSARKQSIPDLDDLPDLALPEAAPVPTSNLPTTPSKSATANYVCMFDHSIENFPVTPTSADEKVEYPAEYHISGFSWVASSVVEELAQLILNTDNNNLSARDVSVRSMASNVPAVQEGGLSASFGATDSTSGLEGSMINLQLGDAIGDTVIGSTGVLTNAVQTEHGFYVGTIQELPPLQLHASPVNASPVAESAPTTTTKLPSLAKDATNSVPSQARGQPSKDIKTDASPTTLFQSLFPGMEVPPVVNSDGSFTITGTAAPSTSSAARSTKKPASHSTVAQSKPANANLKIAVPKDDGEKKSQQQKKGNKRKDAVVYPVGMSPPATTPTKQKGKKQKKATTEAKVVTTAASTSTEKGRQLHRAPKRNSARKSNMGALDKRDTALENQATVVKKADAPASTSAPADTTAPALAAPVISARPNTWAAKLKSARRSNQRRPSKDAVATTAVTTTVQSGVSLASVLASSNAAPGDNNTSASAYNRRPLTMAEKLRTGIKF